jgi:Small integral membrane protein
MAPPGSAHPAFSLGGLTIIGGAVGYFKKGSKASLGAGLFCGSLLIGSGILISGEHQFEGHSLATATSALMSMGMGHRYIKTGKVMPAGLVAAAGAVSMAFHAKKALDWK